MARLKKRDPKPGKEINIYREMAGFLMGVGVLFILLVILHHLGLPMFVKVH